MSDHSNSVLGNKLDISDVLILFYNTMWDQPLQLPEERLPDGCIITTDLRYFKEANAVVFHIPSLRRLPKQKPSGQIWIAWSIESEINYPQLRNSIYMRHFDLTMTYRQNASVPLHYFGFYNGPQNLADALRSPPKTKSGDKSVSLLISSRIDRSGRTAYVAELTQYLDIHSYGRLFRNRRIDQDEGRKTKLELIADYKFNLAFENSIAEDYVTEKFYDPLVAGSVPVYLGAPNVDEFAPGEHCYINTADFSGPKELADYLLELQHDKAAYAAYLGWKEKPFRPYFVKLLQSQVKHPFIQLYYAIIARREQSL